MDLDCYDYWSTCSAKKSSNFLIVCHTQGKLKILLASAVSQYTITFTTDRPVTNLNFWEGQLTGSGTTFTLQSPSYFSGKTAGDYLEHGFQLSYAGNTEPTFTSISFNGVDLCSGSSGSGVSEPVGSTEAPCPRPKGICPESTGAGCWLHWTRLSS